MNIYARIILFSVIVLNCSAAEYQYAELKEETRANNKGLVHVIIKLSTGDQIVQGASQEEQDPINSAYDSFRGLLKLEHGLYNTVTLLNQLNGLGWETVTRNEVLSSNANNEQLNRIVYLLRRDKKL